MVNIPSICTYVSLSISRTISRFLASEDLNGIESVWIQGELTPNGWVFENTRSRMNFMLMEEEAAERMSGIGIYLTLSVKTGQWHDTAEIKRFPYICEIPV